MNWKPVILLSLLAAGGTAAYIYFKKQAALLAQYKIDVIGFNIVSQSGDVLVIDFKLRLTNKSDIEATITKMYADIYLNNVYAGNAMTSTPILVPATGQADSTVRLTTSKALILKNVVGLLSVLLSTSDIPYQLKGYAKIKSSFVAVSIPFDQSGGLKKDLLDS